MIDQYGSGKRLKESEREAIDKQEFMTFEQKRIRGTGYDLMRVRDKGWGSTRNELGGEVVVEWNVEGAEMAPGDGVAVQKVPKGMFYIRLGKESALIDAEAFRNILRWV